MDVNKLKYIDCHSHPHDEKYEKENVDIDQLLIDLKNDGGATIAIGTDYENSKKAIDIANKYSNIWATIGVHPADNHAEIWDERFENLYKQNNQKIVGVGECGLDYYYFENMCAGEKSEAFFAQVEKEKDRQKKLFVAQIEFSAAHNLPLVLHGRPTKNSMDAYRDMLDILEEYQKRAPVGRPLTGHAHFFVGNLEIAKRFLAIGFLMSFDGPITFSTEYDEVIRFLPMENIMIETDSPYAAPLPHRGKINQPNFVVHVAKKIAELKNISVEEVVDATKQNAIKLFKLNI